MPSDPLCAAVAAALSDNLRRPRYRGDPNPLRGHCYVAAEAFYHLAGGAAAGYTAMRVRIDASDVHWWVRGPGGVIIDATARQFGAPPPYARGVATGFLTREPSRRARVVMDRVARMVRCAFYGGLAWTTNATASSI